MIPLVHAFGDEPILIFGGGSVGARRARRFADAANVIVVSPTFADADFGGASLVRAYPGPDDVGRWIDRARPALVLAATDDTAVNGAIEDAAADRGRLVNRADRATADGPGRVVVPATVRDGPVAVAITTGGTSPALAGFLRERIEDAVEGAGAVAGASAAVRDELRARGVTAGRRRDALRALVRSDRVWAAARADDGDPVATALAVAERRLDAADR